MHDPDLNDSESHRIILNFADPYSLTIGGILEGIGLFTNGFVEGETVHQRSYVFRVFSKDPGDLIIHAMLRHPLAKDRFSQEEAYSPLFILFSAWYLAGANVSIIGPWKESFPGGGSLCHTFPCSPQLRPLFQDKLPESSVTEYPSFETLTEIYDALPHHADWNLLRKEGSFQRAFSAVERNQHSANDFRLKHRSGLIVDLVVRKSRVECHVLKSLQPELGIDAYHLRCEREAEVVRTWWDAWIGHCPSMCVQPPRLLILPDEIAILSNSPSICRYQIQDRESLDDMGNVDFGSGVHPRRSVETWLSVASRFGESGLVDLAIACCLQAIATATEMVKKRSGLDLAPRLGMSTRDELDAAETEYLRWLELKESQNKPNCSHDRWDAKVRVRGVHELLNFVGSQWSAALEDVVQAIQAEHYDSEDYHRSIGRIRDFFWNVNGKLGSLRYKRLLGSQLMSARVPKDALKALGFSFNEEVIPLSYDFEDLFTLTLGNWEFWGSVHQRMLICVQDPCRAYAL